MPARSDPMKKWTVVNRIDMRNPVKDLMVGPSGFVPRFPQASNLSVWLSRNLPLTAVLQPRHGLGNAMIGSIEVPQGRTLLAVLFAGILLSGQTATCRAQIAVDSWTADNGLPQNIILSICQTPDGYLWLATFDGMVRFDGVRFTTFNKGNTEGIGGNRFASLFCTASGDFWAGTESSGVTHYSDGHFTTYTTQDGLPSNEDPIISGDDRGHFWAVSKGILTEWHAAEHRFAVPGGVKDFYSGTLTSNGRFGLAVRRDYGASVYARQEIGIPTSGRLA